jgi:hypothetical protein
VAGQNQRRFFKLHPFTIPLILIFIFLEIVSLPAFHPKNKPQGLRPGACSKLNFFLTLTVMSSPLAAGISASRRWTEPSPASSPG